MMNPQDIEFFLQRMEDLRKKYYDLFLQNPQDEEYRNSYKYYLGLTQGLKIILK